MSQKWREAKAWEDQNLRGPLLPLKWILRAWSSITLAVTLLVIVALYGASASIPVGLIALAPTYLVYGLIVLGMILLLACLPAWAAGRVLANKGRGLRFTVVTLILAVMVPASVVAFVRWVWPPLHYDPADGSGLRFFAEFVERYKSTQLRRLPGVEMSELEFYSWWPLRVVLLAFVVNLAVATVRRIDFNFKNIGVLTVHTGIIVMALGSVYYSGLKLEGDTVLPSTVRVTQTGEAVFLTPPDGATGAPATGAHQMYFYDNTDVSLYVDQFRGWEQRPLRGVPRYNEYNPGAMSGRTAWEAARFEPFWQSDRQRSLSVPVARSPGGNVDADIRFRIVGYSPYAEPVEDWLNLDDEAAAGGERPLSAVGARAQPIMPLRLVFLHSQVPDDKGVVSDDPMFAFKLVPDMPAERVAQSFDQDGTPVLSIEYTRGMSEARWAEISAPVPAGAGHALLVEVPATGFRAVYPAAPGERIVVGETGFRLTVDQITPRPPFPVITKGFENAECAVAQVGVLAPNGEAYQRYVYSRFAELDQDILGTQEDGRPNRRNADGAIRIRLVEADHVAVYIDEPVTADGPTRVLIRRPGEAAEVRELPPGEKWIRQIVSKIDLHIAERWDRAVRVERPRPVPDAERDKDLIGNHAKAMIAVEVSSERIPGWSRIVWIPNSKYFGSMVTTPLERAVDLPDGRRVNLAWGARQIPFMSFELRLVDFQMIAYDHRGAPRDYQSIVRVTSLDGSFETYEHITKLNEPLTAPFLWSEERPLLANILGRLGAGLSPRQFKLSQAGWDREGWQRTQAEADQGRIKRPYAQWTILGVGNNPGIHIIALGSVMIAIGIPWAFYIKPWLVQREKARIQAQLAAGTYTRPGARVGNAIGGESASGGAAAAPESASQGA